MPPRVASAAGPALLGIAVTTVLGLAMARSDTPWTLTLDAGNSFLGQTVPAFRAWAAGRVPEWTDLLWSGFPAIAEPTTAALYPLHWIPFALTREAPLRFFDVALALHAGLFTAGAAMLLRALGARAPMVLLGGFLTAITPYWHPAALGCFTAFAAVTWYPWTLVAAEGLLRPAAPLVGRSMALGWVALAAQVYAGMPEQAVYSGTVATAWLAFRRGPIGLATRAVRVAVLAAGAMTLAAPQILTTLAYLPVTTRAGEPMAAELGSLWLGGVHRMLVPSFGAMSNVAVFLGAATLVLAATGLARRRAGTGVLLAVGVVALLLALGPQVGLYGWLRLVPPFDRFRVPIKLYGLAELAVVWSAVLGIDALLGAGGRLRRLAIAAAAFLVVERAAFVLLDEPPVIRAAYVAAPSPAVIDRVAGVPALHPSRPGVPPPTTYDVTPPFGGHWLRSLGAVAGVATLHAGDVSLLPQRHQQVLYQLPKEGPRLTLLGVRTVIASAPQCPALRPRLGWTPLVDGPDVCIVENPAPPAMFVATGDAVAVDSVDAMVAAVVTARPPALAIVAPPDVVAGRVAGETVVMDYAPGRARLAVSAPAPTLLLVRQSHVPGWSARVDGAPAPLHPAAGLFFAVPLEAGAHVVELAYRAPGLRVGIAIAAAWLLGAAVVGLRRRRAVS